MAAGRAARYLDRVIPKKTLVTAALVIAALWAFALYTGSLVVEIVVGVVTALVAGVLLYAYRTLRKHRGLADMLKAANESPEARADAIAQLEAAKDADAPASLLARAQLVAQSDPKAALALLDKKELRAFPPAMQDDVALLKTQLYLATGRTRDARTIADTINLDNPSRAEVRTAAAVIIAEALARTGKPKDALALLDTLGTPREEDAEHVALQSRVVRVFAKFALGQRAAARAELVAIAEANVDHLGRFVAPQFRVHPELVKLARQVAEQSVPVRRRVVSQ